MRTHLRTVKKDRLILDMVDLDIYLYKEIVSILGLNAVHDVDNAVKRRKRFPHLYVPGRTDLQISTD